MYGRALRRRGEPLIPQDSEAVTGSEEETEALGHRIASTLASADVVYLVGDLGAGKTCLARGIARGLSAGPRQVASPTFALLHEYAGQGGGVVLRHLDLYRLRDTPRELEVLALPESVRGAPLLVEWPNRSLEAILPPTVRVALETLPEGRRKVRISRAPRP